MPVLDTCKFEEDLIKNEGTILSTTLFWRSRAGYSEVKGRNWIYPRFYGCAGYLQVWWWLKMKALLWPQHYPNYWKSMGKMFCAQWQVTPKQVVWSGPKSNSSEILCLSWIPASLKKIRSKMKGAILPTKYFGAQGLRNQQTDVAGIGTDLRFHGCPPYLQVWWQSNQKWGRYCVHNIFSIISLWEKLSPLKGK